MYRPQHVFMITKGPRKLAADGDVHCMRTGLIFSRACRSGTPVEFWFMSGWLCPNVRDFQGFLEVQPQLLTPLPILVEIRNFSNEVGNYQGLVIFAEVKHVPRYFGHLSEDKDHDQGPILQVGDLLQISYHLVDSIGGFSILGNIKDVKKSACIIYEFEDHPPVVNSLSQLHREYVGQPALLQRIQTDTSTVKCSPPASFSPKRRGCSVYKIAGTNADFPISHDLRFGIVRENVS